MNRRNRHDRSWWYNGYVYFMTRKDAVVGVCNHVVLKRDGSYSGGFWFVEVRLSSGNYVSAQVKSRKLAMAWADEEIRKSEKFARENFVFLVDMNCKPIR